MAEIARGEIHIEVDDAGAIAQLEALDRSIDRKLKDLDGKEATLHLEAEARDFDRKIKEAESQLRKLEHRRATAKVDADTSKLDNAIERAEAKLKGYELANHKLNQRLETLQTQRTRAVEDAERKREDIVFKGLDRQRKAQERATRESIRMEKQLARERESARMAPVKFAQDEAKIARLAKRYRDLAQEQAKLERQGRKLSTRAQPAVAQSVELNKARAIAEMAALKAELQAMGREPPVDIAVDVDEHSLGAVGRFIQAITETTVRVGPFTTTISTFARVLTLLGPIVIGIAGQIGALGAVLAGGLGGALGVATAATLGFGMAAGGIFAIVKPLAKDFMDAKKATDAYNQAVRQYGAGSDQAAKKQKILNHVLGDVPENTRRQFVEMGRLNARWKEFTATARPEFFRTVGDGIQTISDIMPMFARHSNEAFSAVSGGLRDWMRGIRSAGGQSVLSNIFKGANDAIQPLMGGLGQLGAALGRIGQGFAPLLRPLAQGFERWATGLSNATKNGDRVASMARRMVDAMRAIGHVGMAAARVLGAFVTAGMGPGADMLNSWADGLNRLAAGMNTVGGQRSLSNFFRDSIDTASRFFSALQPIGEMFFEWSTIMRPFTDVTLAVVKALSSISQAIFAMAPAKAILQGIFGVMLASAVAGKINAVVGGVTALAGAFRSVEGAAKGAAAAQGVATAAGGRAAAAGAAGTLVGGARGGAARGAARAGIAGEAAAAGASAAAMGKVGVAAEQAATKGRLMARAMTAIKSTALGAAVFNPWIAGLTAVGGLLYLAGRRGREQANTVQEQTGAIQRQNQANQQLGNSLPDLISQQQHANLAVKDAKKYLDSTKKGTLEHRQALLNYRDARRQATQAEQTATQAQDQHLNGLDKSVHREAQYLKTLKDRAAEDKAAIVRDLNHAHSDQERAAARERLAAVDSRIAAQADKVTAAQNRQAAGAANQARAMRGLIPVAGAAEQALGRLAKAAPKTAIKIATKFESPQDAGRVAASASKSLRAGVPQRIVTKIVADSKSAEEAVRRLQSARLTPKTLRIIEHGGDAAIAKIESIIGRKLTPKEQHIAEQGGSAVLAMLARIMGIKLPNKTSTANLRDNASGVAAAIAGAIAAIPTSKTSTITTVYRQVGKGPARAAAASGKPLGKATGMTLVGEGKGPEIIANARTGAFQRVDAPTFMQLGAEHAVIPTEPAFRARGRDFAAVLAKQLGIPGYKSGKKAQKPLSENAKAKARAQARKHVPKSRTYSSDDNTELPKVQKAQRAESDANREVSIYESQMKEPESFISQVGADAEGNPIYAINQAAINNWVGQLTKLASLYDTVVQKIREVQVSEQQAMKSLMSVINRSSTNIGVLNTLIGREQSKINGKKTSKHERARAKERLGVYKEALDKEKTNRSNAQSDYSNLEEDFHDTNFRIREASQSATEARADASATAGKAGTELAGSQPTPTPVDPFAGVDLRGAQLEAQAAQAAAGMGGDAGAIIQQQIANEKSRIDVANALLRDADPRNDQSAYQALTSAYGNIQNLQGQAGNASQQSAAYSTARGDILRTMGGNFTAAMGGGVSSGYLSPRPSFAAGMPFSGGAFGGGGGTVINVNNTFPTPPPDPHTFSNNLAFELSATF